MVKIPQNLQPLPFPLLSPLLSNELTVITHWRADSMLHGNKTKGKEVFVLASMTTTAVRTDRSGIKWLYRVKTTTHNRLVSITRMSWDKTEKALEEWVRAIHVQVASRNTDFTKFVHSHFIHNLYIAMCPVWLFTGIKSWEWAKEKRNKVLICDLNPHMFQ